MDSSDDKDDDEGEGDENEEVEPGEKDVVERILDHKAGRRGRGREVYIW
jgi:hypothetical protein